MNVSDIITILSLIAAILAWVAKIRWSNEYSAAREAQLAAKDETIATKDGMIDNLKNEIENLRELSPPKIREYYISMKDQLEEYIDDLNVQLTDANEKIVKLTIQIDSLSLESGEQKKEVEELVTQRSKIENSTNAILKMLNSIENLTYTLPGVDYDQYRKRIIPPKSDTDSEEPD